MATPKPTLIREPFWPADDAWLWLKPGRPGSRLAVRTRTSLKDRGRLLTLLLYSAALSGGRNGVAERRAGVVRLKQGEFGAARDLMAKMLEMSARDVPNWMAKMVGQRWIEVVREGGGKGHPAVYRWTHWGAAWVGKQQAKIEQELKRLDEEALEYGRATEPTDGGADLVGLLKQRIAEETAAPGGGSGRATEPGRVGAALDTPDGRDRENKQEEEPRRASGPLRGPSPSAGDGGHHDDDVVPACTAEVDCLEVARALGVEVTQDVEEITRLVNENSKDPREVLAEVERVWREEREAVGDLAGLVECARVLAGAPEEEESTR